jgi:6-phosphogluconolactonase (cycloisomerase 2 family)
MRRSWQVAVCVAVASVVAGCSSGSGGQSPGAKGTRPVHALGGTVNGILTGSGLVLQNNGGDDLTPDHNGIFTFPTNVAEGLTYHVTVKTNPLGRLCSVSNGDGTMGTSDFNDVVVDCSALLFTVGGTVSGLASAGLVLQNNDGDDLTPAGNGGFAFPSPVASGAAYHVTVKTNPPSQTCSVTNGSGTMGSTEVTNVEVVCAATAYPVGGSVSGLAGTVVLQNNGADDLSLAANGPFTFPTPVAAASRFAVTVKTQPAGQTCTISYGSGTMLGAVTGVAVTCAASTYTVGGNVTGLTGTLVLQTEGGDNLVVTANGPFTFATALADRADYRVTVKTQPSGQTCSVTNGANTVNGANVTDVAVSCASSFKIYGTTTGVTGQIQIFDNGTLVKQTASNYIDDVLVADLKDGATYDITVVANTNWTCEVTNGTGTIAGADVHVGIACAIDTYALGGSQSGLAAGKTLVLQNNGRDDLAVADPTFVFSTKVAIGATYAVTVKTQPAGQICTVSNGSGTMPAANVGSVSVVCSAATYTVGGSASGLSGPVVLQVNGAGDVTIGGDGPFTFAQQLPDLAAYLVTVKSSGPHQRCTVSGAAGTVAGGNVTTAALACVPIAVHRVYAASAGSLRTYPIDGTSGALAPTPTKNIPSVSSPEELVMAPNGKWAYVLDSAQNDVAAYALDPTSGDPTFVATVATGTRPRSGAVDPTSTYLYVAGKSSNDLSAYAIDGASGALTPVVGSPFISCLGPSSVTVDPAGAHVYVTGDYDGIFAYAIGAGGALSTIAGTPYLLGGGANPMGVGIPPNGKWAYVPSLQAKIYAFNLAPSGALDAAVPGAPFALQFYARGVPAIDGTGTHLYQAAAPNGTPGSVSAHQVDAVTGALAEIAGSPYGVGIGPAKLVLDSSGFFVFVWNSLNSSISAFTRDPSTGALAPVAGSPFSISARAFAVTP